VKAKVDAGGEIPDRPGHDDPTIAGLDESARGDMNTDPSDILVADLDLSRVNRRAHTESQVGEPLVELKRASERPGGRIERGEDAVAGGLHEVAAEPFDRSPRDSVVTIQELTPPSVAESGGASGRIHDIGEQDRCQHTIRVLRGLQRLDLLLCPGERLRVLARGALASRLI